jgi:dihydrolipoamide dehydrogenase
MTDFSAMITKLTGRARIIVNEERHVIIGATLIGPQVGELLHPATIAIICEIPLERLWHAVGELLHPATIAIICEIPLERLWHAVPSFPTMREVWLRLLENYGL